MSIKVKNTCSHCQGPVLDDSYCIGDNLFCCSGCAQVYQFLKTQKLDGFYGVLEKIGEKTESLQEYETPQYFSQSNEGSLQELKLNFNVADNTWELYLPKIHCAACLWLVDKVIQPFSFIEEKNVNLFQQKLTLKVKETTRFQDMKELLNSLHSCGYTPLPLEAKAEAHRNAHRESLIQLSLSGFCFGNIMLISFGLYFGEGWDMSHQFEQFFRWISALFTIPVIWAGRDFFLNAYEGLKRKTITIDFPIAFASGFSLVLSYWHTFKGEGAIYYDSVSALFFFLLLGRFILKISLDRNRQIEKQVKSLIPQGAKELPVGSSVTVAVGQVFPVDGVVITGKTLVNEAVLTGEEDSIIKQVGDRVLAGTVNMDSPVTVEVEKSGEDTWIASLQSLIEEAQSSHTVLGDTMSRIVPWFTFTILTVCAMGALYWWSQDPQRVPEIVLATLVASCPCALGLAAPLTFSQAIKKCWDSGVAIKSALHLENLMKMDTVIFDKTGTLTRLQPKVLKLELYDLKGNSLDLNNELGFLGAIYSALKGSAHPVSIAAAKALEARLPSLHASVLLKNLKEKKGAGMEWEGGSLGKAECVFQNDYPGWFDEKNNSQSYPVYDH